MRHLQIIKEQVNVWRLVARVNIQISAGCDREVGEGNDIQLSRIPNLGETAAGSYIVVLVIQQDPVEESMWLAAVDARTGVLKEVQDIRAQDRAVTLQCSQAGSLRVRKRRHPADQMGEEVCQGIDRSAGCGAIELVPVADADAELIAGHDLEHHTGADDRAGRVTADLGFLVFCRSTLL